MSTSVKIFHSGMTGAPALTNAAGALLALLDACLVDGWGTASVDSVAIASGVATVTIGAGHPFEVDSVALLAGATTTGGTINGERRVLTRTATSYTFAAAGMPDQTATGTITHKVAPLGWGRPFSGTNKAVYRSADAEGTRMYFRVDDSSTTSARGVGYEEMTTVDAGVRPFPTEAQLAGGTHWAKSSNAAARSWVVVGDSRGFYIRVDGFGSATGRISHYFGDFISAVPADPYCAVIAAGALANVNNGPTTRELSYISGSNVDQWCPRSVSGFPGAVTTARSATNYSGRTGTVGHSGDESPRYPNPADGALLLSNLRISESGSGYRGHFPGFYYCPQNLGLEYFQHLEKIEAAVLLPGRKLIAVQGAVGVYFLDITGPWR